jgi:hypothetical protein
MLAIRQLAHDFPVWANGPAENMLQYHAKRIFHIRNYSVLKKQLVLQIYRCPTPGFRTYRHGQGSVEDKSAGQTSEKESTCIPYVITCA